jgi:2,3-bisphosphoglycerate-independent phosphoglycerate mutase
VVAVLVIPDGAAQPGEASALAQAHTPVLDALAAEGEVARVEVTAPHLPAGSETGIPALLGHAAAAPVGRGRVDAAAYGVRVPAGLTPWRADVLRADGTRASALDARALAATLGPDAIWTRGHRLVLVAPDGQRPRSEAAPHGRDGDGLAAVSSARGPDGEELRVVVWDDGATLPRTLGLDTAVVAGPGAAAGCARLLGADVLVPETATGDVDTDLAAKARAARAAIMRGAMRVVVHVGGPDEAAHRGDRAAKRAALEALDGALLAPLRAAVAAVGGTLAVCPDHHTDPATGAHGGDPVPALRWGAAIAAAGPDRLTERAVAAAPLHGADWPLYGTRVGATP